ncbi:MAG: cobalamin biosynthesis protein P47K [Parasporobacterium sp.]|nr:cobalamin biosynthesis protein P47K [Parasporobacterium sp.]
MKLIILSGFLGAGKTSILMPLAHEIVDSSEKKDGTRLAIIENEIGQVGIDTVFTEGSGYSSRELFNGCVCCSMAEGLMDCLVQLQKEEDPEWVILETTGLARPAEIAENIWNYYDEDMSITTCIVVDASRWLRLIGPVGSLVFDQLKQANYVLMNKIDLADAETIEKVKADIEGRTDGKAYAVSVKNDPEGAKKICQEIVQEIKSWE